MEFIIHPYEGVEIAGKGIIRFGMKRDKARLFFKHILNALPKEVDKGGEFPFDFYLNGNVQISYSEKESFCACEFSSDIEEANHSLSMFGQHILGMPFIKAKAWLVANDPSTFDDRFGACYTSLKFGVCLGKTYPDTEHLPSPNLLVFENGYLS